MILSNQARCPTCQDEPFSRHRHDYQSCKCGAMSVDGGMSYIRRSGDSEDMSIIWPDDLCAQIMVGINSAVERGCNARGILCQVAIMIRDAGYDIAHRD